MKKALLSFIFLTIYLSVNACGVLDTITLTILPAPTVTIEGPDEICANSTGTLTVLESYDNYIWSTGDDTDNITISDGGTYSVTVTNDQGCEGDGSIDISVLPLPDVNITLLDYECDDQITADAGPGFDSYEWSDGGGTEQLAVYTTDGTYTVTVTDNNGCTNTNDIAITIPDDPVVSIGGPTEICSNESALLSATEGFASYEWSTGQTQQSITINLEDIYEVTVTDDDGCTATASISITVFNAPIPELEDGEVCPDNLFTLTVLNGSFVSYLWNTNETTSTINAPVGNYSVTVTDINGCTGSSSSQVTEFAAPAPEIFQFGNVCNGIVQLALDQPYDFVEWSTNEMTPIIDVTESNTYSVTVTNANGCEGTADITVDFSNDVTINIIGPSGLCNGNIASLEAVSTNATNFEWNTGETSAVIIVSEPNTYTVTATDDNGCTNTAEFELFGFDTPNPIITGPDQICEGSIATLGLTETYITYLWSTNENTEEISINAEGEYTVTVTNAAGCTASNSITITTSTSLSPSINITDLDCGNSATLNAGSGYSTYLWNTGDTTPEITVDQNGSFSVTVTDNTGCSGSDTEIVDIPAALNVTIEGNNSICENSETTLSISDTFDMVQWNSGSTADTLVVDTTGMYIVLVMDENGCEATDTFIVTIIDSLEPTIEGDNIICDGDSTLLSISETFTDYNWSTGAETSSIFASSSGLYEVTVSDASGCTGSTTFEVDQLDELNPIIEMASVDCSGSIVLVTDMMYDTYLWSSGSEADSLLVTQDGEYQITVTNENGCSGIATLDVTIPTTPDLTILGATTFCAGSNTILTSSIDAANYQWNTGSTADSIVVTSPGLVILTIVDSNGCAVSDTVDIVESDNLNPSITGPTLICNDEFISINSVNDYETYLWSTGETTQSIETNTPGTYGITVTDVNGCSGTNTYTVTASTIQIPIILNQVESCAEEALLTTSESYAAYLWSTGEETESIIVTDEGIVTLQVTNAEGCTSSNEFEVLFSEGESISIGGDLIQCDATETELFVEGSFTDIMWSTGESSTAITITQSGMVTVEGTDAEGCTSTDTVEVLLLNEPNVLISYPTLECMGETVSAEIEGDFESVQWSNGEVGTTALLSVPFVGSVSITTIEGCTYSYEVNVDAYPTTNPILNLTANCEGSADLSLSQAYPSYIWSTGSTDATINIDQLGVYEVTIMDDNGCTASASITVSEIPQELQVTIEGDSFLCEGEEGELMISGAYDVISWFLDGQLIATGVLQIPITTGGQYRVEVGIGNDCTANSNFEVIHASQQEIAIMVDNPPCTNEPASLSIQGISTEEIASIQWSNGDTSPQIFVEEENDYSVLITTIDGCILEAPSIFVNFASTSATLLELISCDEEAVGIETFFYTNAAGCDSIVTVVTELTETPEDYIIDLGEDRLVNPEEIINLIVSANFQIIDLSYDSPYELSCTDCLDPEFIATTSGLITVIAFDSLSCAISNSLQISIEEQDIILPNIINPNSPLNGLFTITNNNPFITVNSMVIFDRWGNLVFLSEDENTMTWDGTMNGNVLTPGVYVYLIKYTHVEDGEQVKAGDLTIIR